MSHIYYDPRAAAIQAHRAQQARLDLIRSQQLDREFRAKEGRRAMAFVGSCIACLFMVAAVLVYYWQ